MLCHRKEEPIENKNQANTEIEAHSISILNHYGSLLENSSEDFDNEVLII